MAKKPQLDWLDNSVLYGPHVCLCATEELFIQTMKRFKVKQWDEWVIGDQAAVHSFISPTNEMISIVCMDVGKSIDRPLRQVYSLLLHEAIHIKQFFFKEIGETNPGREIEAYVVQRIAQTLFTSYDKQKEEITKCLPPTSI